MPTDFPHRPYDPRHVGPGDHLRGFVGAIVAQHLWSLLTVFGLAILFAGFLVGAWWESPPAYVLPSAPEIARIQYPPSAPPVVVRPPLPPGIDPTPYPSVESLLKPVPPVVRPAVPPGVDSGPYPSVESLLAPASPVAPSVDEILRPKASDPFPVREPYFTADPTGMRLTDIEVVPQEATVLHALGDWLRLPTRPFKAASATWKKPQELNPFQFTVTADGKGVAATPTAAMFLAFAGLCLLACLLGRIAGECAKTVGYHFGFHHVHANHYDDRPRWVRILEGVATSAVLFAAGVWSATPGLAALGIFSIPLVGHEWRGRLKGFATMLGLAAGFSVFNIPVASPPEALAASYGSMGIYCWDIVATSFLAVAFLVHWIPFGGQRVTYVTVAPPRY